LFIHIRYNISWSSIFVDINCNKLLLSDGLKYFVTFRHLIETGFLPGFAIVFDSNNACNLN